MNGGRRSSIRTIRFAPFDSDALPSQNTTGSTPSLRGPLFGLSITIFFLDAQPN
jgi:hypothetical protein